MISYTPYKGRTINPLLRVKVYRNLHKDCYSIQQDGVVVGHTKLIHLLDCKFKVSEALRDKVRKTRRKNVHAVVEGYTTDSLPKLTRYIDTLKVQPVYYNPHLVDTFVYCHIENFGSAIPIHSAPEVKCSWNEHTNFPNVRALLED
jgi:hypothetical protein